MSLHKINFALDYAGRLIEIVNETLIFDGSFSKIESEQHRFDQNNTFSFYHFVIVSTEEQFFLYIIENIYKNSIYFL